MIGWRIPGRLTASLFIKGSFGLVCVGIFLHLIFFLRIFDILPYVFLNVIMCNNVPNIANKKNGLVLVRECLNSTQIKVYDLFRFFYKEAKRNEGQQH